VSDWLWTSKYGGKTINARRIFVRWEQEALYSRWNFRRFDGIQS
jgi:hypothetical protein